MDAITITGASPSGWRRRRFQGGMAYGATDEVRLPRRRETHPPPRSARHILHQMGIDHERLTFRYSGRDHRLTDVHGQVIREIIA